MQLRLGDTLSNFELPEKTCLLALVGLLLVPPLLGAENALHRAVCEYDAEHEVTKALEAGADPNARDSQGRTPLLVFLDYPSCRSYQMGDPPPEPLRALLRAGADPNLQGPVGDDRVSAVHRAIGRADGLGLNRLALVLRHGGDLEAPDSSGDTPLVRALRYGKPVEVAMLLGLGAEFPGPILGPTRALELARRPRKRWTYGKMETYVDPRIEEVVQAYAAARAVGVLPETSDEDWLVIPEDEDRPRLVLPRRVAAHLLVELGDPEAMRLALAAGVDGNMLWGGRTPAEYALELVEEKEEDYPAVLAELVGVGAMIQCEKRSIRAWVRRFFAPLYDAGYGPAQDGVAAHALDLGCLEGHCEDLSPLHDDLREGEFGPDMVDMGYVIEYGVETSASRSARLTPPGTLLRITAPSGWVRVVRPGEALTQGLATRPNCPALAKVPPGEVFLTFQRFGAPGPRRLAFQRVVVEAQETQEVTWRLGPPPPGEPAPPLPPRSEPVLERTTGTTPTDLPHGDPRRRAATRLVRLGLIDLHGGRLEGPRPVNRYQLAVLVSRLLAFLDVERSPARGPLASLGARLLPWIPSAHWAHPSVDRVLRAGVQRYQGRSDLFGGIDLVSHGELCDTLVAVVDVVEGRDPHRRPVPHGPDDEEARRRVLPEELRNGVDPAAPTDRLRYVVGVDHLLTYLGRDDP